jgi:hypothetical protein
MQKRKLGKSNLEISALVSGCMGMSCQYFSTQVVAIRTFWNYEAGNPRKHWSFGRGGGDRNYAISE